MIPCIFAQFIIRKFWTTKTLSVVSVAENMYTETVLLSVMKNSCLSKLLSIDIVDYIMKIFSFQSDRERLRIWDDNNIYILWQIHYSFGDNFQDPTPIFLIPLKLMKKNILFITRVNFTQKRIISINFHIT